MDGGFITFFVVLIILAIIGFVIYLTYNYIAFKKNLHDALLQTTKEINNNFDVTTSNLGIVREATEYNIDDLINNSNTVLNLSQYSSNTSNVISGKINKYFENNDTNFSNLDKNINRYFQFNDGNTNISSGNTNNKIFNYVFGANIPNIHLITKTTAISGLTINSDVEKELKICASTSTNKCIKMTTDTNGNFNISPAGTSNIKFKNNNDGTMLNIDTHGNSIYLGGDNPQNSAMYVKNSGVYMKNIYLVNGDADAQYGPVNYASINTNNQEINLGFIVNNSKADVSGVNTVTSMISITASFPNNLIITDKRTLTIQSNSILVKEFLNVIEKNSIIYKDISTQDQTNNNHIYFYISFNDQNRDTITSRDTLISTLSGILSMSVSTTEELSLIFAGNNTIQIPNGFEIKINIKYQGRNLTLLNDVTPNFILNTQTSLI